MKKFKQLDCWISCILIIAFIGLGTIGESKNFIIGYFVVGGWQVISMLVHAKNKWFTARNSRRDIYQLIVFFILLLALAGIAARIILGLLAFPMLFAAPIMALYYTWICYDETYIKMQQRPIALLK